MTSPDSPNTTFQWAVDATFDTSVGPSGSAWHNEANKVLPVELRVSQGYVPSQSLDAESLNYLLNSHGQWIGWASSSIDDFNVELSLTASNLQGQIDVLDEVLVNTNISSSTSDAWDFLGGPQSKTVFFSPFDLGGYSAQIASGQNAWYGSLGKVITSIVIFPRNHFDATLFLPSGSTVTRVRAAIQPGAARSSGSRMLLTYSENTGSVTIPGFPVAPKYFSYDLDFDNGTFNNQFLDSGVISIDIDNKAKYQWFTITGGDTADTQRDDVFYWAITYDDPGPRNL